MEEHYIFWEVKKKKKSILRVLLKHLHWLLWEISLCNHYFWYSSKFCGNYNFLNTPSLQGQNGQKKYQINLKSSSGPIHVLLINKESNSSKPMVFPVPPPDDLAQTPSQPVAPVTPLKPTPASENPPEHGLNQGQQLPETTVDTPSGALKFFFPPKMGKGRNRNGDR